MTNHEDYGNYKPQKPLSSRLRVSTGTNTPDKVKRHSAATAAPQGLPECIHPFRASAKQQATAEGTAGELKDYLLSEGDTEGLSGWEAYAVQVLMNGEGDAINCF